MSSKTDSEEIRCTFCGSLDQVVRVQPPDGPEFAACRGCYAGYKRRHMAVGVEVATVQCSNCGETVPPAGRCIRCGEHLNESGDPIRVGGSE